MKGSFDSAPSLSLSLLDEGRLVHQPRLVARVERLLERLAVCAVAMRVQLHQQQLAVAHGPQLQSLIDLVDEPAAI